jgi:rubredoxin
MNEDTLNLAEFNSRSNGKWENEPIEIFKCNNCKLIFIGLPDCHTALIDPTNLDKIISYNLPRKIVCPNCNILWYDIDKKDIGYRVEDVSTDELRSSGWHWLLKENI